jgi:pimeloyl-ACP methyl ester carboxylesterase
MQQSARLHSVRPAAHDQRANGAAPADFIARDLNLANEMLTGFDWLGLQFSPVYAGIGVARGHGVPVVLIPGMLATNVSLGPLRRWLRRMGYAPCVAEIERNSGCPDEVLACVLECIDKAHAETGRKVSIIGHSLGGAIARAAALAVPEKVARVITLGAPVDGCRVHPFVAIAGMLSRGDCDGACMASYQDPLPAGVEETSIYSKRDGIVDWRTCWRDDADSIEVDSTHCGMIFNAGVYRALARILASPVALRPGLPGQTRAAGPTLPTPLAGRQQAA